MSNTDGKKLVDLLDEDPVISSQKYIVMSFVDPEEHIKNREHFLFEKFVQQWQYTKMITLHADFLNFLGFKHNIPVDSLMEDYKEFVTEEKAKLKAYTVSDDFATFLDKNEDKLNEEFNIAHKFQTSTRGFKFRGAFSSVEEAKLHAEKLKESDTIHNILVGQGFVWTAWNPNIYKTGNVVYAQEELNQLFHEKQKNKEKADQEFEARVKEAKQKAIEENIKKAQETGNKLTQTIDEQGNLVGANTINYEEREVAEKDDLNRVD